MRILITGAAGFIGSALANRLVELGHEVRGLDDGSTGDASNLHSAVSFIRGDVNDMPKLWSLLQGIDCVYHLAARVSVQESIQFPREYNAVNVGGTVSILEAMRVVGVKRVVFSSSGAVYGEQLEQPLREAMPPDPRSPYAVSKLAAEYYIRTAGILYNIETVSLRIFNAYGPGQHLPISHPPVVPSFLRNALRGASLVIFGNGNNTRDYVYIDDVVSALVTAATAPAIDRLVINIGSGVETSMNELTYRLHQVTGKELSVLHNPVETGGVSRMRADLTLAAALLGFTPRFSLEDGLAAMLNTDPRFSQP